jgi:hypothetical protein
MHDEMTFRVEPAGLRPDLARAMNDGQRRALSRYGLEWMVKDAPPGRGVLLLVAEAARGALCAGLRLHRRTADGVLPLEEAISVPQAVQRKLEQRQAEGLAEACAFWVAPEVHDRHLAVRLLRFALAVSARAQLPHLVALAGPHSLPLALRVGFALDPSEPAFAYPDAHFRSRLVWRSAAAPTLSQPRAFDHEGVSP